METPTLSTDQLREEIYAALASGALTESQILNMVSTATVDYSEPELPGFEDPGLPIYTELPPGLIDVPNASVRYCRSKSTFYQWIRRGYVTVIGRLKAPARGGGYLVLSEAEIVAHMAKPVNRGGRPQKPV